QIFQRGRIMPTPEATLRSKLSAAGRRALLVRCGGRSCSGVLLDADLDRPDWRPDGALVLVPALLLHGAGVVDRRNGKPVIRRRAVPAVSVVLRRGRLKPRAGRPPAHAHTLQEPEDDLGEVQARVLAAWRWGRLAAALPQLLAELRLSSDAAAEPWTSLQPSIRDVSTSGGVGGGDPGREARELVSMFLLLQLQPVPAARPPVLAALREALGRAPPVPARGAPVCTASAPLAAPGLLGAVCQGVVSGTAPGGLLTLTDARVTPGCEGAGVYSLAAADASLPCAVVLSPLTWWRGEAVGFTLCLDLRRLLEDALLHLEQVGRLQLAPQPPSTTMSAFHNDGADDVDLFGIDKSVVLVRCAHMWGSGVVIGRAGDRQGARPVILTCAHVLLDGREVTVCWGDHALRAEVVWRSADGEPFDVAVLLVDVDEDEDELCPLPLDCRPPHVGEAVVAAGFPLFSERSAAAPVRALRPLVSRGEVSGWWTSASSQILTTCTVQSGASGGPLLRLGPGGEPRVIGVLVCNAQVGSGGDAVVYPHVNFALWADAIHGPIDAYLKSGDKKHLGQLQCKSLAVHRQWKLQPPRMCKL
ncbi:Peroxisomal leader peptide-processing protease, partial [Frankliniella fusca]